MKQNAEKDESDTLAKRDDWIKRGGLAGEREAIMIQTKDNGVYARIHYQYITKTAFFQVKS